MSTPTLKVALRTYPYTEALKSGTVAVSGAKLEFEEVKPHIAAFRRMVRDLAFDACEIAPTTYIIARAYGVPIIALPVFFVRRFHHEGLVVRPGAGIEAPKDLEGKNFGVRAYSVTTGVWKRGLLQNEYGVDIDKVNWWVDDEEHVAALKLPANVRHVAEDSSLVAMMAKGKLDAACTGDAGIGRAGKPGAGWNESGPALPDDLRQLFPNAAELDREVYARNGVYPIHGTLAIKEEVLQANPGLARSLYDAFVEAKAPYLEALRAGTATGKQAEKDRKLMQIVGDDPLPYGLEANRASIEALIRYGHQQGLIPRPYKAEDMFLPF
ncbi:ABC transporter substrate-binding protein [Paracoccus versutus]|uniref:4,5-dihydroxyphthalate decarboxylase n=1 Tax=Paracoccus versutus TaxID=34007 RepID=A0A3D9XCY0_PARVE|nr:PhnD/SsuA/transferrin family substrate-binding protein [Paracoccus versutus]REF68437.1 4,5-dihydroxyphthalate decarboxylase [Paracoccus versutus]WGR56637.1 ABC transporter substrate-binding protein [Paracoccus versutus]WGR61482.1 ABC transporter substrate-binding protein [Paracoccus ferrooxidans]